MSWREFEITRRIATTPQRAFDFVADYRNVPRVLEGVSRWEPLSDRATGKGARFEVEMKTFGIPLANVLVLDEWEPDRRIAWRSESGLIEQRGGWTFAARRPEATDVTLAISYRPPGAAVGNLLAGRVDSVVRARLARALDSMTSLLEREPA